MAVSSSTASSFVLHELLSVSTHVSPKCYKTHTLPLGNSRFLSSKSILRQRNEALFPSIRIDGPRITKRRVLPVVFVGQSNFLKVIQTAWKVGKDGVEAGTSLVPDTVPRPVARVSVTVVALTVALFVLKSFLSTAFFVLATMGVIYFVFLAFNKDDGPRGGGTSTSSSSPSEDDSLEEARRIMDKYN